MREGEGQKARRRSCGTVAAPRCVVEALAGGAKVSVEHRGASWYLVDGDVPLARRGSRQNAQEALAAAEELAAGGECPPCGPQLSGSADERRRTRIVTPQVRQGEPAHYELVDADQLVASHSPLSFQPDPRYPDGVQERQYQADRNEQAKVVAASQQLDPAILLSTAPTTNDGPPMVTEDRLVLGGNGRSMAIKRAYAENGSSAYRYREALRKRAVEFGFSQGDVDRLERPVLVRVVEGLSRESSTAELAQAVRRYNEGLTNALDAKAKAVAQARQLSDESVRALGELLRSHGDASLRDVMRDDPGAFLRILEADGIVTGSNRSEWMTRAGALTESAKDALEGMFLGRVLGQADRLSQTAPALLKKLERAVPYLVAVAGVNPAFNLIPLVQRAVDLLNDAAIRGITLEELVRQVPMFVQAETSPAAAELARLLRDKGQREVGRRFAAWARVADFDPRQSTLFGEPPTVEEAFDVLTQDEKREPNPPHFADLEAKLEEEGARDPKGLAAWILRNKYGEERLEELAEAGRRKAEKRRENPTPARQKLEDELWRQTHRDYRGELDGERAVLVLSPKGTTLAKVSELSDKEIAAMLGRRAANPSFRGAWERTKRAAKAAKEIAAPVARGLKEAGGIAGKKAAEKVCQECRKRCAGEREANPMELGVAVARDYTGKAAPAIVRLTSGGKLKQYLAVGKPAKSSFETAFAQATALAKKLGLPVAKGVLKLPGKREPNPSYVAYLRSDARTPEGLVQELRKTYGAKLPLRYVMVRMPGLAEPVELELEDGRVKSARCGAHQVGRLKAALNKALG